MAEIYTVHPQAPQVRQVEQIRNALQAGAVMLYPTDTVYAIGCDLNSKSAIERVRRIKHLSNIKPLTFLCDSLSHIATYARVSDLAYRIMKRLVPGPYTFLLPATKLVPRLVQDPKRKTTGIRVPDHTISLALLKALGNPIISTSAHLPGDEERLPAEAGTEAARLELFDRFDKLVDLVVDDGSQPGYQVSTILDLSNPTPEVVRQGLGWEAIADSGF